MTIAGDIKFRFIRALVLNLFFLLFLDSINNMLAGNAYIFAPAILIVSPALFLGTRGAFIMAIAMGWLFSADLAVNSGLMAALFGICSLGISKFRAKFVNPSAFCAIWLTWGVNMAMFLICALFVFKRGVSPAGAYFLRAVLDALFTSMFIVAFAAFAVNLHKSAAVLSGDSVLVKGEE